ncbi:alpha/beta fold hydrolase [Limnobacter humi]|uniref:Alpha/beta fold hydrolase n=1 Tax=Limnobacter humi TaxID=1778671 RepID=A0ABT1WI36_9BURK|nr:alpha/beta fold hydrolase [Limnobacter humi]MCQ8897177.1 alpha/beta fold hydrolase [Limnobacter humi]
MQALIAWIGLTLSCLATHLSAEPLPRPDKPTIPESSSWTESLLSRVFLGHAVPAGANNWSCRPSHGENPVVLIHGTFSSSALSFGALAPRLSNAGVCVFTLNYGGKSDSDWFQGVEAVDDSAQEVTRFIGLVKAATGARHVTLVGHSQGGLVGFYSLKFLGARQDVNRFIALAPSVQGTRIAKTPKRSEVEYCLACADQHPKSDIVQSLRQGGITVPGVSYAVLASKNDQVVLPVESQFVREPGVQNLYIQDVYPEKTVSHSGMLYDDDSLTLIVDLVLGRR